MISIRELTTKAQQKANENKKFFARLKRKKPRDLDTVIQQFHHEAFAVFDCLECANCCKSISPAIYHRDVDRIAKDLRIKPSEIVRKYLQTDTNDYVFRQSPCPFLMADNYCLIYENRPKSCREYPHTNRRRFHQILNITLKNTFICPIVYEVVDKLKNHYN